MSQFSFCSPTPSSPRFVPETNPHDEFYGGIDVGSRFTKVAIINDLQLVSYAILDTGTSVAIAAEEGLSGIIEKLGIKESQIKKLVGTGYGRVSLSFVDKTVTELTCHAAGCHYVNPEIRMVIDIGGQDTKVLKLDDHGSMVDFVMNDKCAAGTGKFLEMVARTLDIDLEALSNLSDQSVQACDISNMCVVFAESEIISLLAKGVAAENIVAGIYESFSRRIGNMVKRLGIEKRLAFVGGVAKNKGLRDKLSSHLEIPFLPMEIDPQITGALGAAVLAKKTKIIGKNDI